MVLATDRIRSLARSRGLTLGALLERARVSRTAYYSLARRPSVLPRSILALARTLGVHPQEILDGSAIAQELEASARVREATAICAADRYVTFENVWHTLSLLELSPLERLNRSLLRGRLTSTHG